MIIHTDSLWKTKSGQCQRQIPNWRKCKVFDLKGVCFVVGRILGLSDYVLSCHCPSSKPTGSNGISRLFLNFVPILALGLLLPIFRNILQTFSTQFDLNFLKHPEWSSILKYYYHKSNYRKAARLIMLYWPPTFATIYCLVIQYFVFAWTGSRIKLAWN